MGSMKRSMSPAPRVTSTSSGSFSRKDSSSALGTRTFSGAVTSRKMISEVTPGMGSSRAG